MAITKNVSTIRDSEQGILGKSRDDQFDVLATEGLGFDGQTLQRANADNMAMKMTVDGSVTYIAIASPGTAQSAAKWQVKKLDETTGIVITWADGNADFDNVASDLTALTYS